MEDAYTLIWKDSAHHLEHTTLPIWPNPNKNRTFCVNAPSFHYNDRVSPSMEHILRGYLRVSFGDPAVDYNVIHILPAPLVLSNNFVEHNMMMNCYVLQS